MVKWRLGVILMDNQNTQIPNGPLCQSCGMPLKEATDFGTEADGSQSEEYCTYCYQDGKFTNPDATLEEMIELVTPFMVSSMGIAEEEAKKQVPALLPQLKRWQKSV